ncbi:membrane protein insertase YidC [Pseudonocardia asaccharolytica]|uniref:Membrane protein insertase YidC n=1 Tax=Pseudonocardia asaccharolytica DSM 44247 = NBRC 16224 TaxID=1123024 RepID=A0A511D6E6_9PSEU|nr:membrane protein insertase YidC [Pseudonocardia asaccharolytica]GEL18518.1 membrane protein insertase YidC [Pseudonocardia asaccharolytica DSM 44247 = NBRC 16224]
MLNFLYYPISAVMWFWHQVFGLVLGASSGVAWALSVIFLVLTLRALMIRPFISQVRSGRKLRVLAPQLAELRKRHADDKQKLVEETQRLQREHGVNMMGGCLPMLIQAPVFIALYHVLRYFNRPGLSFEQNAAIPNYVFSPDEVRSFLEARLFGAPLSSYISMPQSLLDSFGAHVERWEVVAVAVPLVVLAAVATHLNARFSARQQQAQPLDAGGQAGQLASIVRWTPWIFPLGVIVGGLFFAFPIAILLYWLTNNAWTMTQQHLVFRRLDAEEARSATEGAVSVPAEHGPHRTVARAGAGRPASGQPTRRGGKAAAGRKRSRTRKGGRH